MARLNRASAIGFFGVVDSRVWLACVPLAVSLAMLVLGLQLDDLLTERRLLLPGQIKQLIFRECDQVLDAFECIVLSPRARRPLCKTSEKRQTKFASSEAQ